MSTMIDLEADDHGYTNGGVHCENTNATSSITGRKSASIHISKDRHKSRYSTVFGIFIEGRGV